MNPRVFIHENGWSGAGELNDRSRVEYLRLHLQQVLKALNDGCNVIGYTGIYEPECQIPTLLYLYEFLL